MNVEAWIVEWSAVESEPLLSLLSPDEHRRADRFANGSARSRFVIARGLLRRLIGRYLAVPPTEVRLDYASTGKPRLAAPHDTIGLRFSVSHADRFGLIALARGVALGVDVETSPAAEAALRLADRFFTSPEAAQLRGTSPSERAEAFAAMWAAKEALIKARGETVPSALSRYEVDRSDDGSIAVGRIEGDPSSAPDWRLDTVRLAKGHTAAVAVKDPRAAIRWQRLND